MTVIPDALRHELDKLNRAEKLRVIQWLASDLAADETATLTDGATYEVWSPLDAPGAAQTLLAMLAADETADE